MALNKNKSGIVVFADRLARTIPCMKLEKTKIKRASKEYIKTSWEPAQKEILGFPICNKYKYLGTYLSNKLTCEAQLAHIRKKSGHLFIRLFPYLKIASAECRRDMWQTMVKPLFQATMALLTYEPSVCHQKSLETMWKCSFKQFMMISKRTRSSLVKEMIQDDIKDTAGNMIRECMRQWEQRKQYECVAPKEKSEKKINYLRGIPNS